MSTSPSVEKELEARVGRDVALPLGADPQAGGHGPLGIIFPVEYGGAGLGYVEYVVALEELARVDGSVALTVSAHTSLCTNHIYR